jgi:hypothetical protein
MIDGSRDNLVAQNDYNPFSKTYLYANMTVYEVTSDKDLYIDRLDGYCYVSGNSNLKLCGLVVTGNIYHAHAYSSGHVCYITCFYDKYTNSFSLKLTPSLFGIISVIILLINLF